METPNGYGDLFTIDEWNEAVGQGVFIPYDGTGYYGTDTEEFTEYPVFVTTPPEEATHVWWYNK